MATVGNSKLVVSGLPIASHFFIQQSMKSEQV